jgi:hypothetical protein
MICLITRFEFLMNVSYLDIFLRVVQSGTVI